MSADSNQLVGNIHSEQFLAPVVGPLAAIADILQNLVQMQAVQFKPVSTPTQRAEARRSSKAAPAKRQEVVQHEDDVFEAIRTGPRGRKPTFQRDDIPAVLALSKKGMAATEIARVLNVNKKVVEHIRLDPSWADNVLKKWGM
ncbi:hypothetical protein [Methylobacterium sp. ID0610]|uniref:hypothetical protein n=1 Tax=Methylobacterium carpenticola TaxID=3344827 RepID=UPI0036AA6C91